MSTKISKKQLGEDILQMIEAAGIDDLSKGNLLFLETGQRVPKKNETLPFAMSAFIGKKPVAGPVLYEGFIFAQNKLHTLQYTITKVEENSVEIKCAKDAQPVDGIVDSEMSDTSENPVQNKVIKAYVDEKAGSNNLINVELEYGQLKLNEDCTPVLAQYVPFIKETGSIDVENHFVKLKKGKTYQFICTIVYSNSSSNVFADIIYYLRNVDTGENLAPLAPVQNNKQFERGYTFNYQYTPNDDCSVGIYVDNVITSDVIGEWGTFFSIFEIGRQTLIDPVTYLDQEEGLQDTPVGHILTHMGTKAPKHYLICDGSTYNVGQYPYLEQHFKEEFGSVNFFGGDGTSTFAVPDLRGEFLRGSGTNSHLYGGKGETVGVHQNPTQLVNLRSDYMNTYITSSLQMPQFSNIARYEDVVIGTSSTDGRRSRVLSSNTFDQTDIESKEYITSRPTNTSVLYCIKYEPTYAIKTAEVNYSYEERRIGTWVDGKPLYEKTVHFGALASNFQKNVPHNILNVDAIWVYDGFNKNSLAMDFTPLNYSAAYDGINIDLNWVFLVDRENVMNRAGKDRSMNSDAYVTLRYTKTTDQATS